MTNLNTIIHIAQLKNVTGTPYLILRCIEPRKFQWFKKENNSFETETPIQETTIENALFSAKKYWKSQGFEFIHCGFCYTLPERDEVGMNALFYQMVASYQTMTGVYFDEKLNSNCIIQNASLQARALSKILF